MFRRWTSVGFALVLLAAGSAAAQPASGEGEAQAVAPDSPRAALARFLERADAGDWTTAGGYLDAPAGADAPALARQLKAVLDHDAVIDLDSISPLSAGPPAAAGQPAGLQDVAQLRPDGGAAATVRLARREGADGVARWVFSRGTVRRIAAWYDALPDQWLRDELPEWLLRPGPQGLFRWQWIALPLLALLAWGLGRLLSWLSVALLRRLARRTKGTWDDAVALRMAGPLTLAWALAPFYVGLPWLLLPRAGEVFVRRALSAGFFVVVFWALLRTVRVIGDSVRNSTWGRTRPGSAGLVALISKSAQVVVFAIAIVAVLAQLGYPVASLLAGLGIGGLAVAFAAQKTLENLFGSVALGVDQPFRPGDFVRIDDMVGTVESIGLRSSRIRTLDRTLVSIPNGKLADMRLENFGARDRIRLSCTLGLVYQSTAGQVRSALANVEAVLRAHPKIWSESMMVRLAGLGASSIDIDVMAWFTTSDWGEFTAIRQEVLLGFLEAVEQAGTSLAYPTQTVHIAGKR